MKICLAALVLAAAPTLAADHRCAADARARAQQLLSLHFVMNAGDPLSKLATGTVENLYIDETVRVLKPIGALKGKGKFDVLEVTGSIYKADYRIRMIYAQFSDACTLMGQEILEASDPY
jgi:hypothetical protein